MYVITFYSFKGGVGRTMALVNVAAELVRRGRKVLVVDFDLEAPGLETYKHLSPPKPHPGIVEYVTEYRRTNAVPDFHDFIYETKRIGNKGGRLWVMPAGRRDRAYRNALTKLDWQRLYTEEEGFLLFEDTKAGWQQELKPDYVLIDSRTGDTDVLGICTRQLPDAVVLMFTPNEQNLAGLNYVVEDIRREETEGLKKRIQLHFVAANVPNLDDEQRILQKRLEVFETRLQIMQLSSTIHRYESLQLLTQCIVVLNRRRSRLANEYRRLVRMLIKCNRQDREGAMVFLQEHGRRILAKRYMFSPRQNDAQATLNSILHDEDEDEITMYLDQLDFDPSIADIGDYHPVVGMRRAQQYKDPLDEIAECFLQDVDILNRIAECRILGEEFAVAARVLDWVVRLQPDAAVALYRRALCRINLGDLAGAADDLLAYVRLPGPGVIRAVRKLKGIAPDKVTEAASILEQQRFEGVDKGRLGELLASTDEGIPFAAKLLRQYLSALTPNYRRAAAARDRFVEALLRARCWQEVIELLSPANELEDPYQVLQLALGSWGARGSMPKSLCKLALQRNKEAAQGNGPGMLSHEAESWLLWRLGDIAAALQLLDKSVSTQWRTRDVFSLWQQRRVSVEQYLHDCHRVRRMLQGEALVPAFLGMSVDNAKQPIDPAD